MVSPLWISLEIQDAKKSEWNVISKSFRLDHRLYLSLIIFIYFSFDPLIFKFAVKLSDIKDRIHLFCLHFSLLFCLCYCSVLIQVWWSPVELVYWKLMKFLSIVSFNNRQIYSMPIFYRQIDESIPWQHIKPKESSYFSIRFELVEFSHTIEYDTNERLQRYYHFHKER